MLTTMLTILMIIQMCSSQFIVHSEAESVEDDVNIVTAHDFGVDFDKIAFIDLERVDHVNCR